MDHPSASGTRAGGTLAAMETPASSPASDASTPLAATPVVLERDGAVAIIRLNRPQALNSLDGATKVSLRDTVLAMAEDDSVRCVVLTGSGRAFSAGQDLKEHLAILNGPDRSSLFRTVEEHYNPTVEALATMPKPVIAAVNGVAAGLGLSYMLYYDMRFASDRARFGTVFARRGLVAEHGSAFLLPRLVGMHNAADLLFSGRLIDAQEALAMGLVNRVIEHDRLLAEVREYACELATKCSPRSLKLMKRQLYGDLFTDLGASIRLSDHEMVRSFGAEDFKEGVASFLQRRPPRFTGR